MYQAPLAVALHGHQPAYGTNRFMVLGEDERDRSPGFRSGSREWGRQACTSIRPTPEAGLRGAPATVAIHVGPGRKHGRRRRWVATHDQAIATIVQGADVSTVSELKRQPDLARPVQFRGAAPTRTHPGTA
jgi:hypothetical protein